jgi:hypothetical protein
VPIEQAPRQQVRQDNPVRAALVPPAGLEPALEAVKPPPQQPARSRPARLLWARPIAPGRAALGIETTPDAEPGPVRPVLQEKPARRALALPMARRHPMDAAPPPSVRRSDPQPLKPPVQPSSIERSTPAIAATTPMPAANDRLPIDREAPRGARSNAATQSDGPRVQPEQRVVPLDKPLSDPRRPVEAAQKSVPGNGESASARKGGRTAGPGMRPEMPDVRLRALPGPAPALRPPQAPRPSITISIGTLEIRERPAAAPAEPLAAVSPRAHQIDPGLPFGGPVPGRW